MSSAGPRNILIETVPKIANFRLDDFVEGEQSNRCLEDVWTSEVGTTFLI